MGPLLPLAALAAGGYYLYTKHEKKVASGITSPLGQATRTVKGRSGNTWDASIVQVDGENKVVEIIYKSGSVPAQPHMVIRYVQQGSDDSKRFLATTNPNTSPGLIQAAMADFGVTGPVAT